MLEPGVYPASVTPMEPAGTIDLVSLARLLAWFEAAGCRGVVIAGTNGEGPSLSAVQKRDLVRATLPLAGGMKVILGVATPSLDEAIWLTRQSAKAGAAAGLVMAPGYFREASEEGIARWFERLLDNGGLPILVYNFPRRSGFEFSPSFVARLATHPNFAGLKDSSGEAGNLEAYAEALRGTGKALFVGDETLLEPALKTGWAGTISGAANSVPRALVACVRDFADRRESASAKFELLAPTISALRAAPQPATHKALLCRRGILAHPDVAPPLLPAAPEVVEAAWSALQGLD